MRPADPPIIASAEVKRWLREARDTRPIPWREALWGLLATAGRVPVIPTSDLPAPIVSLRAGSPTLYGLAVTISDPAPLAIMTFYRHERSIVALTFAAPGEAMVAPGELARAVDAFESTTRNGHDPGHLPLPPAGVGHRLAR